MMRNKKGFTLIELLAVIVILAVIALVTIPLIIGIVEDARKGAFKNTAYGILEAGKFTYTNDIVKTGEIDSTAFTYADGVETSSPAGKSLAYKGTKPKSGTVVINTEGKIAVAIYDGTFCAEKGYDETEVTITQKTEAECQVSQIYTVFIGNMLINAAEEYFTLSNPALPAIIKLEKLQEDDYITTIYDSKDPSVECEGYAWIKSTGGSSHEILPYFKCGTNYLTDGYIGQSITTADVLVIAGGGSGASTYSEHKGGAGGAGGLVFRPNYSIQPNNITIAVGAGGAAIPSSQVTGIKSEGNPGQNSTFADITAYGGGRGGRATSAGSRDGGSGGGGHYALAGGATLQAATSGGFGNTGGSIGDGSASGYGGGGAGQPGKGSSATFVADGTIYGGRYSGGDGLNEVVIASVTYNFAQLFGTSYGQNISGQTWFAGGGGGGYAGDGASTYGAGGRGGGGRGAYNQEGAGTVWGVGSSKGEDGIPNTGGGGGSARGGISGAGGSGIVMVRYSGPQKANGGIITSVDGYTIHTFLSGTTTFEVINF